MSEQVKRKRGRPPGTTKPDRGQVLSFYANPECVARLERLQRQLGDKGKATSGRVICTALVLLESSLGESD